MKATVVIPTYNRCARLAELLRCLETQGEALARVVVCDDGSSDDTAGVVRSFVGRLPVVYAHQENRGFRAGQARNMGIARAVGDVIIFVDDDVLVAPDFTAQHLAVHASGKPRVGIGYRNRAFDFPREQPTWEDIVKAEPDDRLVDLGEDGLGLHTHPTPWFFVYSCNFSIRRNARDGADGDPRFDDAFVGWGMEDIELGYRLHRTGYDLVPAPRAGVLHIEDPRPRDPFRCEVRSLPPTYDSYVKNSVYFMDKYPDDAALARLIRTDMRWYVRDEARSAWVKNGHENDVEAVLAHCRHERRARSSPPEAGAAKTQSNPLRLHTEVAATPPSPPGE
jgi:glycosyltransferase involved in cell wall biosynthesis